MNQAAIIKKTAAFVQEKFSGESTGHDWWHMYRVWQLAKTIAVEEKQPNMFVVELGALLHDIADWKFHGGDMEAGPKAARAWLESVKVDDIVIRHIEDIIRTVSFKGAGATRKMKTLEGRIIYDADKLDAMGAVGIARAFAYGGNNNREIYDPNQDPTMHKTFEEYRDSVSHTINHFYEKLLLLKDLMQTKVGKEMAEHRHTYMEQYLDEFYAEWNGKY